MPADPTGTDVSAPAPPVPRYGEASLADLTVSLLAALDVPGYRNPLFLEPARRACLLVVDGLGWELLLANRALAPFLAAAAETASPLTTGFPSTTASSLGSIGTGRPPGEHGLVGYTIALPGMERAFNCLRWAGYGLGGSKDLRDRFVPERLQPEATAFERAVADGVAVTLVGPGEHANSGFTRAVLRGGRYADALSLGDQAAGAAHHLAGSRRSLVYAYHPDLDKTGHVRGTASDAWRLQLAHVDRLAAHLADRLPRDAVLLVTGDHGMVDLRPEQRIDLADQPELADAVQVARRGREERNRAIGERLERLTGVGYADAVEVAGASALSRAHFARALIARGAVADVAEAFDRFLSAGRPAYVPAPGVSVTDAVAVAGKAGGVAVLAHPGRLAAAERERVLGEALEAGIDGIEVWHPQHDPDLRRSLERLADRRGLLATGGSDYHGRHKPDVHIGSGAGGNVAVPAARLHALRARLTSA
jgi:hypothetical protein